MAITPITPGTIAAPVTKTSVAAGTIAVPTNKTAVAAGAIAIPATKTSIAQPALAVPVTKTAIAQPALAVPVTKTAIAQPALAVPVTKTAIAQPVVLAPVTKTSVTASAIPRTLTPLVDMDFSVRAYAQNGNPVSFANLFTYTRSSSASFINRRVTNGQYEYFIDNALTNVLRHEFNPTTGEAQGALIEGASTNLALRSEEFDDASWGKSELTVTTNAVIAPDGTTTAEKLIPSTVNTVHQVSQIPVLTSSTTYTISVYAKSAGYNFISITPTTDDGISNSSFFDLSGGVIGLVGAGHASKIQFIGDGWYLCSISFNTGVGANANTTRFRPEIANSGASYAGDGTSGVYIWGAQIEAQPFATSYIKTTSAAVTRASDNLTILSTGNIASVNSSGTIHLKINIMSTGSGRNIFKSPQTNNLIEISSANQINYFARGAVIAGSTGGGVIDTVKSVTCIIDSSNSLIKKYENGGFIAQSASSSGTDATGNIGIGSSGVGAAHINGHIKKLSIYNKALTAQEVSLL